MNAAKLIFVYGTLKRGGENQHYLAAQTFMAEARTTPGLRLFDVGGYPGMVEHARDREGVEGEVWFVDPTCLQQLDELEGIADRLYQRKPVPLLPPFADQNVDAYFYPRSVEGRTELGSVWPTSCSRVTDPGAGFG